MFPQKKICFCGEHGMIMWIQTKVSLISKNIVASCRQRVIKHIGDIFYSALGNANTIIFLSVYNFCYSFYNFLLSTINIFCLQFFYDFFKKRHAIIILQFSQVQITQNIFLLCQRWFKLKTSNWKITRKLNFSPSIYSDKLPLSM